MAAAQGVQRAPAASWQGMSMKSISLVTLLYYSRIMPLVNGHRYFTSTAVFLNEVVKLAVCVTAALYEISSNASPSLPATSLFSNLASAVFTGDSWKLAIPATLYTLQNSLQYFAISHLDAATLQVTYQFKIIPTAIFSILILQRSLSAKKWASLALLMLGVAVIQLPLTQSSNATPLKDPHSHWHLPRALDFMNHGQKEQRNNFHKRSATYQGIEEDLLLEHPARNEIMGVVAALIACTISALGSVYFEKIVKEATSDVSIWVRNVQLSVYSLFSALFIGVVFLDGEHIAKSGFFTGYNWVVWTVITCQALGGIIVALCVYYADTVAKSFATSISILLSLCLSMLFFDFTVTPLFLVGTLIVLYATYLYNSDEALRQKPPSFKMSENEKTLLDRSFAIKLPPTPLKEFALSTSRPSSPALHHKREGSTRSYFPSAKKE